MSEERDFPREICGYEIIEILGEGGMSVVYTAMQSHPKRKVALKILRGGMYSPTAAKRFRQEVEILGKLDHPWIAKIYDAGSHDDGNGVTPFYVMEYLEDARELTEFLAEESLPRKEVLKLFAMITSAVEHGHHRDIVHRDLKPGNILIDKNGEPKIIDFGVARSLDRGKVGEEAMTEAGRLVGTVQFMSPEQVDQNVLDIDVRCDVYSLGAVLYQMLTGRLPRTLEGLPIYEAVRQICEEPPVTPTMYDPTIDQDLEAILLKALATHREDRYQTAGAFGRDMLRYLGNKPIKARRVTTVDRVRLFCLRHKKSIAIWGILIFLTTGLSIAGWYLTKASSGKMESLQARLDAMESEKEVPTTLPQEPTPVQHAVMLWSTQKRPTQIQVSSHGDAVFAVVEDMYVAYAMNGQSIPLPPINIDPSEAKLLISQDGKSFAVLADGRGRTFATGVEQAEQLLIRAPSIEVASLNEQYLAIAGTDLSLELLGPQGDRNSALSTTGLYQKISIHPETSRLAAATENWIYLWDTKFFPKQSKQLRGLKSPAFMKLFSKYIAQLNSEGKLLVVSLEKFESSSIQFEINDSISYAAMSADGTQLAFLDDGLPYLYDLGTRTIAKVEWMTETAIGLVFDHQDQLVMWTIDGAFFKVAP